MTGAPGCRSQVSRVGVGLVERVDHLLVHLNHREGLGGPGLQPCISADPAVVPEQRGGLVVGGFLLLQMGLPDRSGLNRSAGHAS